MQPTPGVVLLSMIVVAVALAGVWCWIVALARVAVTARWLPRPIAAGVEDVLKTIGVSPRLPLIPWSPRQPVPWAFFDLLAFLALWFMASVAVSVALRKSGGPSDFVHAEELTLAQSALLTVANIVISGLIAAIGLPIVALRTGAKPRDFGWLPADLVSDLKLGLIGFVMLAPPTYALQALLVYIWKPSNHPLMEMFKSTPDARFFALLVIAAAIVAPIFEELMFRVLLQGFLEKAFSFRGEVHELFFGQLPRGRGAGGSGLGEVTSELTAPSPELSDPNSCRASPNPEPRFPSPLPEVVVAQFADEDPKPLAGLAAWLPIAISSLIFALMHWSHGPDWVPLTFLAAGMGYLYQRTHRLLPSLVVHVSLNGLSMWGLWVSVFDAGGSGLGTRG